ncbi:MAG: hypothetical protein C5B50_02740 [Verrucomicrobia bacterium]|nr:MAG: hypothetical protein C5B50_02740 [Verrucomicrobiota bacterium]
MASSAGNATAIFAANQFDWSQIESDDFETLAVRLRGAGCPERTIRDLVMSRAARAHQRLNHEGPHAPFWAAGLQKQRAEEAQDRSREAARAKIRVAVKRAVGLDLSESDSKEMEDLDNQALTRFILGPMPERKFEKLTAMMQRYKGLDEEISERSGGVLLDEDIARSQQLRAQFTREAAALLTPQEYEEFSGRCVMIDGKPDVKWEATDFTPAEVRQIALIRARFETPAADMFQSWHQREGQDNEAIRVAIRAYLGEGRAVEFDRATDSDFQRLWDLGKEQRLAGDAATKAYEIRQLTAQEAGQLREETSLTAEQSQQQLQQIQAASQEELLQVLGATALQQYLQRGGEWVTNISKL